MFARPRRAQAVLGCRERTGAGVGMPRPRLGPVLSLREERASKPGDQGKNRKLQLFDRYRPADPIAFRR
jgi:hypothetical protein